jgi:hypothetical protein
MMHYQYLPKIVKIVKNNYIKKKYLNSIELFNKKYNVYNIKKYILISGDIIVKIILTIILELTKKITRIKESDNKRCNNKGSDNKESINDYLNDDENDIDVEKINDDLDKLLLMGTNIIGQVKNGNKEEQHENAVNFISNFHDLLSKISQ